MGQQRSEEYQAKPRQGKPNQGSAPRNARAAVMQMKKACNQR
jgi:hypothetical protein